MLSSIRYSTVTPSCLAMRQIIGARGELMPASIFESALGVISHARAKSCWEIFRSQRRLRIFRPVCIESFLSPETVRQQSSRPGRQRRTGIRVRLRRCRALSDRLRCRGSWARSFPANRSRPVSAQPCAQDFLPLPIQGQHRWSFHSYSFGHRLISGRQKTVMTPEAVTKEPSQTTQRLYRGYTAAIPEVILEKDVKQSASF